MSLPNPYDGLNSVEIKSTLKPTSPQISRQFDVSDINKSPKLKRDLQQYAGRNRYSPSKNEANNGKYVKQRPNESLLFQQSYNPLD